MCVVCIFELMLKKMDEVECLRWILLALGLGWC